jgi:hypothetical protein
VSRWEEEGEDALSVGSCCGLDDGFMLPLGMAGEGRAARGCEL